MAVVTITKENFENEVLKSENRIQRADSVGASSLLCA